MCGWVCVSVSVLSESKSESGESKSESEWWKSVGEWLVWCGAVLCSLFRMTYIHQIVHFESYDLPLISFCAFALYFSLFLHSALSLLSFCSLQSLFVRASLSATCWRRRSGD